MKKIGLSIVPLMVLSLCTNCGETYTITWKNDNGDILEIDEALAPGTIPSYDGETPKKTPTPEFTYEFSDWDGDITKGITGDTVFIAQYTHTTNEYTVTWKNYDGTVLETDKNVPYGTIPSYDGKKPEKDPDAQYSYEFSSWDGDITKGITGDTVFIAQFTRTINKYTVTWQNDDGSILQVDKNVPYGAIPSYDGDTPEKEPTAEFTYEFSGWDGDITKGITGDTVFIAQYTHTTNKYTVTWANDDGNVLEMDENVPYGTIPSYDSETPTKKGTTDIAYVFTGWNGDISKGITGDTTFIAQFDQRNKYSVSAGETDHIAFSGINNEPLNNLYAIEGVDFSFKMSILDQNSSNGAVYILPTDINIESAGVKLIEGYKIEPIGEEGQEAKVTVEADKIIGNVVLSGVAAKSGAYRYTIPYHFGLVVEATEGTHEFQAGPLKIILRTENLENSYPNADNIYVRFDDCPVGEKVQWVSPAEELTDYCEYDGLTGTLTIKAKYIENNIVIIARTHENILDNLSWEEINKVSISGVPEYVFYLGETKHFDIEGNRYSVKIIDFKHNILTLTGKKAGITLEFNELISDSNGNAIKQAWDNTSGDDTKNNDFSKSTLNSYLNNSLYGKLPSDLKGYIKQVDVVFSRGNLSGTKTYYPYLFPLAYGEYSSTFEEDAPKNEGSIYEYYKINSDPQYRIKKDINGVATVCWLRSPVRHSQFSVWRVNSDPKDIFIQGTVSYSEFFSGVSPAFCI